MMAKLRQGGDGLSILFLVAARSRIGGSLGQHGLLYLAWGWHRYLLGSVRAKGALTTSGLDAAWGGAGD